MDSLFWFVEYAGRLAVILVNRRLALSEANLTYSILLILDPYNVQLFASFITLQSLLSCPLISSQLIFPLLPSPFGLVVGCMKMFTVSDAQ